jgi:hypothetical protein
MTMTWREIVAWLEFSDKLDRLDRANDLVITAIGAQGDKHAIEKRLKDLSADG